MTQRLTAEFRRWSQWYPASWRAAKGAAMLGAYLDQAEAEGRDRLTRPEKAGLLLRGIGARLDAFIPSPVRDLSASVMVSLLGAFGLITGIATEWAPTNPEPHPFGPFVTPFIIVSVLAVAAWLFSMVGPEWLYRSALGAAAATGLVAGVIVEPYAPFWGAPFNFGLPGLFVAVIALMALSAARPRTAWRVAAGSVFWAIVIAAPYLLNGGLSGLLDAYRRGVPFSALFVFQPSPSWSFPVIQGKTYQVSGGSGGGEFIQFGIVPVMLLAIGVVLIGALGLAIAGRRTLAGMFVLATIPWAVYLVWAFVSSLAGEPVVRYALERRVELEEFGIDLLLLIAIYAATIAVAAYFRRRTHVTAELSART